MERCISRRACADRLSFRLYKEEGEKIIQGKYIWTEILCPNAASTEKKTCTDCAIKLPKHKYQANSKCDHGTIGGPYPNDSKLYGSPFYLKLIKEGWKISEADETRAKEAQLSVNSMAKKIKPGITTEATVVAPEVAPLKKPRKKAVKNVITADTQLSAPSIQSEPRFVEEMTVALKIHDVVIVKVKKIKCQGKEYYFDSMSGKVYAVLETGVGAYKGRYDPEEEVLNTSYPDSDAEYR
jgi:hypothetical protein